MSDNSNMFWERLLASRWVSVDTRTTVIDGEQKEKEFASIELDEGFETLYRELKGQFGADSKDIDASDDVTELLLLYYLTANALIEEESIEIITEALVDDEGENYELLKTFFDKELRQAQRESLLYAMGVLDDGKKGEVAKTRQQRNELAHNPVRSLQFLIDEQSFEADIDRAYRAVSHLKQFRENT